MSKDIINIEILLGDNADDTTRSALGELKQELQAADIAASSDASSVPGVKTDINTALSIAGLGLSAVSTFISVVSYWQASNSAQSAVLSFGASKVEVSQLSKDDIINLTETITTDAAEEPVFIHISKK